MKVFWKWCFFLGWFLSVLYGYIRCNLGIWYGYDGLLLKKNIPVRYDMRQNQPALYQDQSGVTWGNTSLIPGPVRCDMRQYQSYTRTSQVWHEAIPVLYLDQSGVTWGNTSLIPGPVRCDLKQYQPALLDQYHSGLGPEVNTRYPSVGVATVHVCRIIN